MSVYLALGLGWTLASFAFAGWMTVVSFGRRPTRRGLASDADERVPLLLEVMAGSTLRRPQTTPATCEAQRHRRHGRDGRHGLDSASTANRRLSHSRRRSPLS